MDAFVKLHKRCERCTARFADLEIVMTVRDLSPLGAMLRATAPSTVEIPLCSECATEQIHGWQAREISRMFNAEKEQAS